jgi:uncharacterized membrane protein
MPIKKKSKMVLIEKDKLDKILEKEEEILKGQKKILNEESEIKNLELEEIEKEGNMEDSEEDALSQLQNIENELENNKEKPITKITKRDLFKGFIGSSFAIVGHFAFVKGYDLSNKLPLASIISLYFIAYLIIYVMLYYTGFKKFEKKYILKFMPLRSLTLYLVSIFSILLINLIFGNFGASTTFVEVFRIVGSTIILASLGAATADLIGKQVE